MLACVRIAWKESAPAAWQTWLAAAWESRCGLRVGPGLSPTQECYFCSPFLSLKLQPWYHLLCGLHRAGKFTLPCGILHFVCRGAVCVVSWLPRGPARPRVPIAPSSVPSLSLIAAPLFSDVLHECTEQALVRLPFAGGSLHWNLQPAPGGSTTET